ncbi:Oidioi.mRNA.OKI2018_I69.chr1.g292.t1.cds [Oikopleura dioica]|uniref:Oidioi.mRNA.OKI2018_I69.chr1.g292.t1.cds n=1 Tax=Oikopleura dioica TaxID=34765 RepID=A0ABN7SPL3_OIKDI|nr:Oidioi.mRNA.OKI2018_I69.chr1.g292.t1.cds [Oikopleura dioica]
MLGQNANVAINPATASFPPVHPFPQPTNYLPQFSQMSSNWESQPSPSALERYLLPTGPIAQLYQIANFGSLNGSDKRRKRKPKQKAEETAQNEELNSEEDPTQKWLKAGGRRKRTPYNSRQLMELEAEFCLHPYLTADRRVQLSNITRLSERQVKIWFQNRRMKWKREKKGKSIESKIYEE